METIELLMRLIAKNTLSTQRKSKRLLRGIEPWAFVVPPHFDSALGVDGGLQGVTFSFQAGDFIFDHDAGYSGPWIDAVRNVKRAVQVRYATPVSAAGGSKTSRTSRNPGRVAFVVAEMKDGRLSRKDESKGSQDDFVAFLISGKIWVLP